MKGTKAAAILAAIMMTLSGCGSTDSQSSESTSQPAASQAAESNSLPESEEETEEKGMNEKYDALITEMPPEGYDKEREGVTYPKFEKKMYFSQTAGRDTRVNILLPPNYDESKKYPVLYILHGFYDTEEWMARDIVGLSRILTNLQLDGEAEEMIVVLPYIFCSERLEYTTGMDAENCLAYDNFVNDLETDLMPFIKDNYSIAEGRENTAVTGFSMGGRESLFIGCTHPEQFGYIGAVCPAPGLAPGQLQPEQLSFDEDKEPYALLISSSKSDGVVGSFPDTYRGYFEKNGEPFLSHVMQKTGHDHSSVKPHLYNLFRILFKG